MATGWNEGTRRCAAFEFRQTTYAVDSSGCLHFCPGWPSKPTFERQRASCKCCALEGADGPGETGDATRLTGAWLCSAGTAAASVWPAGQGGRTGPVEAPTPSSGRDPRHC
jgi:hypothetical protein